jgi:hypothetical protein
LQSRFSKYFPGVVKDKYSWIRDPFHAALPPNSNFCLQKEENYIDMISRTSLKNPASEQVTNRVLGGHWKGVPLAQQESLEDSPSFHNVLSVRDWIFSSDSYQNEVSFCDEP